MFQPLCLNMLLEGATIWSKNWRVSKIIIDRAYIDLSNFKKLQIWNNFYSMVTMITIICLILLAFKIIEFFSFLSFVKSIKCSYLNKVGHKSWDTRCTRWTGCCPAMTSRWAPYSAATPSRRKPRGGGARSSLTSGTLTENTLRKIWWTWVLAPLESLFH